jgi:hypothetical protein
MRFAFLRVQIILIHLALAAHSWAQASTSAEKFDGPAELPRVYLRSSLADTPAPGKLHLVKAGDDLQQALNSVSCGETLRLEAGAIFTGSFHLKKNPCDDAHWIIIRTSADDSELPPEGTRLTPCYAGVASLPSRPDYHCQNPHNALARIVFNGKGGSGPIFLDGGANHYRLIGLEITRAAAPVMVSNLISPMAHSWADHIVFDRLWLHGTEQDETTRGIFLSGTSYVSVVDSYFSDFHCVAMTGACTDAQAVAGGLGDHPDGPFKIVNNFLEAAAENILFGGGAATATPADIEIRHNHMFKPMSWNPDHKGFVGGSSGKPFIVKNLLEFKNAQRVLVEGNILENVWGGFSQSGFAIVITPKNQAPNVCPLCRVTDVTLHYNRVAHTAGGLQIANVLSDTKGASTAGERITIHDMLFDDMDDARYKGFGIFAFVMSEAPKLHDVVLEHITAFPPKALLGIKGIVGEPKIVNFVFRNSIVGAGEREIISTGGGPINCAARQPHPAAIVESCFQEPGFTHNVIVGPHSIWPKGNFLPGSFKDVGFVNFNNGNGGDYHLCKAAKEPASCKSASKYLKAGTDGKDLGADIDAIDAATSGAD